MTLSIMTALGIIEEINQLAVDELSIDKEYVSKIPNAKTIAAIHEPVEEGRSFSTVAELFADLDKEC
jgi:hypothetical protein